MKVKELRKKLEAFKDDTEVVIAHDECGWHDIDGVKASQYDEEEVFCNLVCEA